MGGMHVRWWLAGVDTSSFAYKNHSPYSSLAFRDNASGNDYLTHMTEHNRCVLSSASHRARSAVSP